MRLYFDQEYLIKGQTAHKFQKEFRVRVGTALKSYPCLPWANRYWHRQVHRDLSTALCYMLLAR